jgi:hypothetical protein
MNYLTLLMTVGRPAYPTVAGGSETSKILLEAYGLADEDGSFFSKALKVTLQLASVLPVFHMCH